ncbi:MAG: hypothetical protein WDA27_07765 [Actinomycetota bacterium]
MDTRCPTCGRNELIPIVYGLPLGDLFERSEAGEIALGGCTVSPDAPAQLCKNCAARVGRLAHNKEGLGGAAFLSIHPHTS